MSEELKAGDTISFNLYDVLNIPWYKRVWYRIRYFNCKPKEYKITRVVSNDEFEIDCVDSQG